MRLLELHEDAISDLLAGRDAPAPAPAPCALSLGSFDGLHLGHQRLVRAVLDAKARYALPASALFTFRRHPRQLLDPERAPRLLTPWRERLALLQDDGVDLVVAADFCPALARTPYAEFVRLFLVELLGMRHFVAGHDVHLGAGRGGNAATLAALGARLGYGFEEVPAVAIDGATVSSSVIRHLLAAGNVARATALLGRPYALWGEVGAGDGRGGGLGFPTANLAPLEASKLLPAPGVYAVRALVPADAPGGGPGWDGAPVVRETAPAAATDAQPAEGTRSAWRRLDAMLNHGRAPTFHDDAFHRPRIEVHLLDFAGDLRGRTLKIEWVARLRDEQRFADAAELIAQLQRDARAARAALSG